MRQKQSVSGCSKTNVDTYNAGKLLSSTPPVRCVWIRQRRQAGNQSNDMIQKGKRCVIKWFQPWETASWEMTTLTLPLGETRAGEQNEAITTLAGERHIWRWGGMDTLLRFSGLHRWESEEMLRGQPRSWQGQRDERIDLGAQHPEPEKGSVWHNTH